MDTVVYLVRHGESKGNKENRMRGRCDFPLTEEGERQARMLAMEAKEWGISAIFTSPLIRAKKTAEYIGRECGLIPEIDEGFHNVKLGEWEGKKMEWIEKNFPNEWKIWKTNPEELKLPGFESLSSIQERTYKTLKRRVEEFAGETFCVVSHRAVLKPLFARILRMETPYYWRLKMDTASYSRVVYNGDLFYIDLFNQIKHLKS